MLVRTCSLYVTGGDAATLARRAGPLPASRAVRLIADAAAALDAAHAAGIVHGGVSPSAMLLDDLPDGGDHLYLADFGLTAATSTIATGHLPLTLDFAAPEQILRRPVDGRADQYALACSAVHVLSGAAPAATDQLADRGLDVPAPVYAVLSQALATAPGDRYPSCGEFAAALRTAFEPPAAAVPPAKTIPPTAAITVGAAANRPGDQPGRSRRRSVPAVLAAAVILAGGGTAAAVVLTRPSAPRATALRASRSYVPPVPPVARGGSSATATPSRPATAPPSPAPSSSAALADPASVTRSFAAPGGTGHIDSVAVSPDGGKVVTGDAAGQAILREVSDGGRTLMLARTLTDPLGRGIWSAAFSPDGGTLAAGDYAGTTCVWSLTAGTSPVLLAGPPGQPAESALAANPGGSTLAAGYLDGSVYLWHLAKHTATRVKAVIAEPASVWGAAFSDRGLLALATANGSTYLVNPASGAAAGRLTDPATGRQGVGAVAFLPGGESLLAGDTSGTTYLWRLPRG